MCLEGVHRKETREHDFPEKKLVNDSHTHDLGKLMQLAELKIELEAAMQANPAMQSSLDADSRLV